MATKKEIKEILKELKLTEIDIDNIWDDLAKTNWKVKSLNEAGKTWRDMNTHVIKQIPTQKERDLAQAEQERIKKENEEKEKLKIESDKKYYQDHFEEIIINKIDNKVKLSEDELKTLIFEYGKETEEGDSRRWTQSITTIVDLLNRNFSINWERGLTECQDNEFYEQPYEVKLKVYQKTITVKEWVSLN